MVSALLGGGGLPDLGPLKPFKTKDKGFTV